MRWTALRTSDSSDGAALTTGKLTGARKLKPQTTNISERLNGLLFNRFLITILFVRFLLGGVNLCAHLHTITQEPRDSAQCCCNESGGHIVSPKKYAGGQGEESGDDDPGSLGHRWPISH